MPSGRKKVKGVIKETTDYFGDPRIVNEIHQPDGYM